MTPNRNPRHMGNAAGAEINVPGQRIISTPNPGNSQLAGWKITACLWGWRVGPELLVTAIWKGAEE